MSVPGSAHRRRVQVPRGQAAWWGVDSSTTAVSIATIDAGGRRGVSSWEFGEFPSPERLAVIFSYSRRIGVELGKLVPPGFVRVERAVGNPSPNVDLLEAIGAIKGGLWVGLSNVGLRGVAWDMIGAGEWKKAATGYGGWKKTQKVNGRSRPLLREEYGVWKWAIEQGWRPADWNEADAAGIVTSARLAVELVER